MERNNNNEPKPKRYYLEFEGKRYILGPDNTVLYLHANNPAADHYYVQFDDGELDEEGDAIQRGHYGWREINSDFDDKIINLIQIGCQQVLKPDPSYFDLEQYQARFGHLPEPEPAAVIEAPEPEPLNLTPRQHNLANYLGYLLLHGHITAEEFRNGTGDLHI